ncbi:MAG: hypothetical protein ACRDT6_24865 [Micromonosporaceae bacterium]
MSEDDPRPDWYAHDNRPPAPPAVKVSASIVSIVAVLFLAYAVAVLLTRIKVDLGWRLAGALAVVVIGLIPAWIAYQLLRGNPLARMIAIALTVVGIVLQLMWFQVWFCWTILFSLVVIAGLVVPDSNRFYSGLPPEDGPETAD